MTIISKSCFRQNTCLTELLILHSLTWWIQGLSRTCGMKFKDFQAPVLFSSTFKALNLGEKNSSTFKDAWEPCWNRRHTVIDWHCYIWSSAVVSLFLYQNTSCSYWQYTVSIWILQYFRASYRCLIDCENLRPSVSIMPRCRHADTCCCPWVSRGSNFHWCCIVAIIAAQWWINNEQTNRSVRNATKTCAQL